MRDKSRFATFFLNNIFFGVNVEQVQEVLRLQEITSVPLAPPFIPGIINLRGQILTAIDLRRRLHLPETRPISQSMIIVVRASDGPVSLLVDEIGDVLDVTSDLCEPPPETLKPSVREVTTHVCKLDERLLLILDTEKAVRLPEEVLAGAAAHHGAS